MVLWWIANSGLLHESCILPAHACYIKDTLQLVGQQWWPNHCPSHPGFQFISFLLCQSQQEASYSYSFSRLISIVPGIPYNPPSLGRPMPTFVPAVTDQLLVFSGLLVCCLFTAFLPWYSQLHYNELPSFCRPEYHIWPQGGRQDNFGEMELSSQVDSYPHPLANCSRVRLAELWAESFYPSLMKLIMWNDFPFPLRFFCLSSSKMSAWVKSTCTCHGTICMSLDIIQITRLWPKLQK